VHTERAADSYGAQSGDAAYFICRTGSKAGIRPGATNISVIDRRLIGHSSASTTSETAGGIFHASHISALQYWQSTVAASPPASREQNRPTWDLRLVILNSEAATNAAQNQADRARLIAVGL